ncbi:MAG: SDR family NAD(P)-dependent oxidoreductase [Candidatus Lokiarchaeota archaeon]|nr:SDR family NAD(P)-dependent oxidoreductase [Candidatus Lokiarchaeota archaeon]
MKKIVVLGGCGAVGRHTVRTLAKSKDVDKVVIADINLDLAEQMAQQLGEKVTAVNVDVNNTEDIRNAIKGAKVVVNTVGPYYMFEKKILEAVIEEGIDYVDVCDDTGATYDALNLDERAKEKGVTALIGMGSSPGVTNILAAFAATTKNILAECESIDLYHIHGGEPVEGVGVIGHRFYCMQQDVPLFLDGEMLNLSQKESEDYIEEVDFINLEGKHTVYPYPHPEPITLPKWIPGVKRVTNKGTVLPEEYYDLTRTLYKCGMASKEPIMVNGTPVIPHDFATQFLIKRRNEILRETNFGEQRGCVKIVVIGKNELGLDRKYIFSLVSEGAGKGQAMGEGTGIPCALGALLLLRGKIKNGPGVLPPEASVNAMEFLSLMREIMQIDGKDKTKKSPLIIQKVDEMGRIETIDI